VAFACLTGAQVTVQWNSNLTVSNNDYKLRTLAFTSAAGITTYESIEASYSGGTSTADAVIGSVSSLLGFYEYLEYYASSASYTGGTGSYSGMGSCVAANYLSLAEVDSSGTQLSIVPFSSLTFTSSTPQLSDSIQYVTYIGKPSTGTLQVTATVAVSEYAGTLTNGGQVTPKSLEIILNVLKYPFVGQSSSLVLNVAVGIANGQSIGSFTVKDGYHLIASGTGKGQAYFSGSTTATIGTNGQQVTVSVTSQGQADSSSLGAVVGAIFTGVVSATGNTNLHQSYQIVSFKIDANSNANITFDPAPGYSYPQTGSNAAVGLSVQFSLLTICLALLSLLQF